MSKEQHHAQLAWITGGGSGIGRALAEGLARKGWRVVVSGRTQEKLLQVVKSHQAIAAMELDVTDRAIVQKSVERLCAETGIPDLVVLNAGDYRPMPASGFDLDLVHHLNEVNYLGAINCMAAVLPFLQQNGSGQVLLMSSPAGYRGLPDAAPYGATKAALVNFAESLHQPLKRTGIRLRIVSPGFVETPLTAQNSFTMPSLMKPEQAAERIIRALDSTGFEITFPKRFTYILKLLRCLPYRLYFPIVEKITGK